MIRPATDDRWRCWRPRSGQAQGAGDQFPQSGEVHRFGQEVKGTGLEGVDRGFEATVSGDHRHWHLGITLLDVLHQLQARAIGQAHVGQAQIECFPAQQRLGFAEVAGTEGIEFHPSQGDFQEFADIRFVVDDQDFLPWAHVQLCFRPCAKVMRKQPPPWRGLKSRRAWLLSHSSRDR